MRFVPLVQAAFLDLVRESQTAAKSENIIPAFSALESACSIQTQISSISQEEGTLISVLMTDEHWTQQNIIEASDRGARYDGLICYPSSWILVIENKPWSDNVWEGQLLPNLAAGSKVHIDQALAVVSWRTLIERLSSLLERKLIHGAECLIVEDFFEFVDNNFFYLNPYGSFSLCKGRKFLLQKRCVSILESIVAPDSVRVKRRQGGDFSFIELAAGAATDAYFYPDRDYVDTGENGEWSVAINIHPGDTIRQARKFFENVNKDEFFGLEEKDWIIKPNLHFAFMAKHLCWAKGTKVSIRDYFEYWCGEAEIGQYARRPDPEGFQAYFQQWLNDGMISTSDIVELEKHFTNTERQSINVCPGFSVSFIWSKTEAERIDNQQGRFKEIVSARISEALTTWGQRL
jgi:hypothetical protein